MLRLDINLVFTIVNIVVLYICMRLFYSSLSTKS